MSKHCKDCEHYQHQLMAKDNEIQQLKFKLEYLEKKLHDTKSDKNLIQADSSSSNFVSFEEFNDVKSELNYYKRGMLTQMRKSREDNIKNLEDEYLKRYPGSNLVNKDFDATRGEDVIDIPMRK